MILIIAGLLFLFGTISDIKAQEENNDELEKEAIVSLMASFSFMIAHFIGVMFL